MLTADEVASILGTSAVWVLRAARHRGMPSHRLGHRTLRFRLSEVQGWLESQEAAH